jgi:hypothetical protein
MVTQASAGRALTLADLEAGKFTDLIPPTNEELATPVFFGDYVLYRSSPNGAVDIYAVQISEGRRYRVTFSKFGADFPSVSPDSAKLIYSDFTASGYNVAELPLDPATWTRIDAPRSPVPVTTRRFTITAARFLALHIRCNTTTPCCIFLTCTPGGSLRARPTSASVYGPPTRWS